MEDKRYKKEEVVIKGKHPLPITLDVNYYFNPKQPELKRPLVIFCHGFKGFKDWGTFNLIAKYFALEQFFLVKLNFSHNGTSPENLSDIHDTEAFGLNNFEIELDDLGTVIDWLADSKNPYFNQYDFNNLNLVGHSRGGALVMLKSVEDKRVQKVACWAPVNDLEKYMYLSDIEKWKSTGVSYVENKRTGIELPLYFQFYENFFKHRERFDLKNNLMKLDKPLLLLHGTDDQVVSVKDSEWIYENFDHAIMVHVDNGDHTFGGKHPWHEEILPEKLNFVVEETIEFFTL
jgi:pimeloyl-ACP methyl ester carboxylesterase